MEDPNEFEGEFVHKFYNENSREFSATRRKHWKMTETFLDRYWTADSIVLDAGCGNGRSFLVPGIVGLDYCWGLLRDGKAVKNYGLIRGDVLELPFVDCSFDLVLSVGVIHHLSTDCRRKKAMEEMRRVLRDGGKMLVYVWGSSVSGKRKFSKIIGGSEQDYFATWNLRDDAKRYYHLYGMEDLVELCKSSGFKVLDHGPEEESLFVVLEK
ncbi:putative methyltransferase [Encephalitozoon intestinalis ATCC 50506]|uniref:Methyltransferase n=1 Tax=Encephalitozoon intestinalis (strain ATCC 50506) TaxID=876142 RepID=E0S8Y2_ENCIT|nr:putative methyltransferase [Encephalitozoon intestinalis ATCC 50506]ADM12248.1 putative methyltransferase [Encephalitozoon intestinalis ATCC 50506]UTX46055.1 tRNA methyltransferase [Encephalitozoon intestinalis]